MGQQSESFDQHAVFKDAKAWSDFIGFHVRMSFLMLLAWVALMPAVIAFLIAFDQGGEYSATEYILEIVAFFFCNLPGDRHALEDS